MATLEEELSKLRSVGVESIAKITKLSEENITMVLERQFGAGVESRVKGTLYILERDMGVDLREWYAQYQAFLRGEQVVAVVGSESAADSVVVLDAVGDGGADSIVESTADSVGESTADSVADSIIEPADAKPKRGRRKKAESILKEVDAPTSASETNAETLSDNNATEGDALESRMDSVSGLPRSLSLARNDGVDGTATQESAAKLTQESAQESANEPTNEPTPEPPTDSKKRGELSPLVRQTAERLDRADKSDTDAIRAINLSLNKQSAPQKSGDAKLWLGLAVIVAIALIWYAYTKFSAPKSAAPNLPQVNITHTEPVEEITEEIEEVGMATDSIESAESVESAQTTQSIETPQDSTLRTLDPEQISQSAPNLSAINSPNLTIKITPKSTPLWLGILNTKTKNTVNLTITQPREVTIQPDTALLFGHGEFALEASGVRQEFSGGAPIKFLYNANEQLRKISNTEFIKLSEGVEW